ncbi:MAG TPA: hypothetical protein VMT19_08995 [Thermoanaerobaculaceae bacterium]|nr:hypothetical protein [Thermoanaerobaculaceae bacterium]
MKRIAAMLLVMAGAASALAGCAVGLVVPGPPPAPFVEVRAAMPGPGFVWIDGYWGWRSRWVWTPGTWARPPHPRAVWVPGRWYRHGGGWRWTPGRWR